jgi:hypothetical protein
LLEPGGEEGGDSFLRSISERIAASAASVADEVAKKKRQREFEAKREFELKRCVASKFFDEQTEGPTNESILLTFGDRSDFYAGLQQLVGKPDPISLAAGMKKDHLTGKDARIEMVASNYGTVTTSEVEYYFVVAPTEDSLTKLGRTAWPVERKLAENPETRDLCRKAKSMSAFADMRNELAKRLTPLNLEFTDDHFVGARL